MAAGANNAAIAIQQSSPTYRMHASQGDAAGFQQQLAAQADSDSESDATSSDASVNRAAKASDTTVNPDLSASSLEAGIEQRFKANSASVPISDPQSTSIKAPVMPGMPVQKSGQNLTGLGFVALNSGVTTAAKHLTTTSKATAQGTTKRSGVTQQAEPANSPTGDTEPNEPFDPSTMAVQQQLNTNSSPQSESSMATKVGSDSSLSPAGTGEASTHTVQQAPSQNVEDVSFAVRLATDAANPSSAPQSGQDTTSIQSTPTARPVGGPNAPTGGQEFPSEGVAVVGQQSVQTKPAFDNLEKATGPTAVRDSIEQPAQPARYLRVQVSGDGAHQVELRMIEHSGTVNVSVRATDPVLSRSLQEGIPELTNRLQADRFHAEVWLPKSAESHSSNPGDSYSSSGKGGAGGEGNSNQPGSRKNQSRPEWVDELEQFGKGNTGRKNN